MAGMSATLLAPHSARAATVTDGADRAVQVPARVERVFPAGPPAAIMLYTLAPELLLGWPRANSPEEREFLIPDIASRPEVGRITGRGNTANLEVVLALKPDLILDVGSINTTYISLADRVQEQTGIPYALLDGRFDGTPAAYRILGNPDVIITIDQEFAANVHNDRAWAPVAAVRARRVHLSPKLPFGWVDFPPSVNRLIGLWWLAKILYPDLFPEDLRALTGDFYRRYYHVALSDAQIDRVLAGR